MSPFSSFYYIKKNPKKALGIIFMILCMAICYLGGIYVKCMVFHAKLTNECYKDSARLFSGYGNTQEIYDTFRDQVKALPSVSDIIPVSTRLFITHHNEMNIENSFSGYVFTTLEDMTSFMHTIPTLPDDSFLPSQGEAVISSSLAANAGIKLGDTINQDMTPYTVSCIFDSEYYYAYALDTTQEPFCSLIIRSYAKESEIPAMQQHFIEDLNTLTAPDTVALYTYSSITEDDKRQFSFSDPIYFGVIALITIVLCITVNAALVGAYDKRRYEFSLYQAIGYSRHSIAKKIAKEILWMDLFGMLSAAIVSLLTLYLVNETLLYPNGMGLPYYTPSALISTLLCNLFVIGPAILIRIRAIRSVTITEY